MVHSREGSLGGKPLGGTKLGGQPSRENISRGPHPGRKSLEEERLGRGTFEGEKAAGLHPWEGQPGGGHTRS
jgi:hypothetical protein